MENETNNQNASNSGETIDNVLSANEENKGTQVSNNNTENNFTSGQNNAQDSIIAQLQAQNAALMQQNQLLNQQVINLVNNGGQLNGQQTQQVSTYQQQIVTPETNTRPTQAQQLQAMGMQTEVPPKYMQPPSSLSNMGSARLEDLADQIGKDRLKR